jgi:hypothetical protein
MTIDYWCYIYRVELEQLYDIFTKVLFKNKLDINKNIPYSIFCRIIYQQSSQKIGKYDEERSQDRELHGL